MTVRSVGAWFSKNHTKVPAKIVKQDVVDRQYVILRVSFRKQKI